MAEETEPGESWQTGQPGPDDQRGPTRPWFPPSPGGFPPSPGEFPPEAGSGAGSGAGPAAGNAPGPGSFGQTTGPGGQQPYGQQPYGQQPYGQAPYGGPPGQYGQARYGGLPQYRGQAPAPKPGIIPLRPIGVSEMLDGAFTAIRRNPRATLGLGAVIMTIYGVIAAITACT